MENYIGEFPLLKEVPKDRLIKARADQPFMATEIGKRLMWSAGLIPFTSHLQGHSTSGVFRDGSVCIVKPLGAMAAELDCISESTVLDADMICSNYSEISDYFLYLLKKKYGDDALELLPVAMQLWLHKLKSKNIDEEELAFDASLLPKESRGPLSLELHMHLRLKRLPGLDSENLIDDIIAGVTDSRRSMTSNTL